MAARKPSVLSSEDSGVLPVYTITHPPSAVRCTVVERQRSAGHIRRLPSAVVKSPGSRSSRPASSSRPAASRNCDILRLIVDEEGPREGHTPEEQHLPKIQEEEEEEDRKRVIVPASIVDSSGSVGTESDVQLRSVSPSQDPSPGEVASAMTTPCGDSHSDHLDTDLSDMEELHGT